MIAALLRQGRGKSALHRAWRRVTPGTGSTPRRGQTCRIGPQKTTALTPNSFPAGEGSGVRVRVKRRCKRPPALAAMPAARQPPPGARLNRDNANAGSREAARLPVSARKLLSRVSCTRHTERRVPERWSPIPGLPGRTECGL